MIYATYPRCQIVGQMVIGAEIYGFHDNVWETARAKALAGIKYSEFHKYIGNNKMASAAFIDTWRALDGRTLDEMKVWLDNRRWVPPQSWIFLRGTKGQRKFYFGDTGGEE